MGMLDALAKQLYDQLPHGLSSLDWINNLLVQFNLPVCKSKGNAYYYLIIYLDNEFQRSDQPFSTKTIKYSLKVISNLISLYLYEYSGLENQLNSKLEEKENDRSTVKQIKLEPFSLEVTKERMLNIFSLISQKSFSFLIPVYNEHIIPILCSFSLLFNILLPFNKHDLIKGAITGLAKMGKEEKKKISQSISKIILFEEDGMKVFFDIFKPLLNQDIKIGFEVVSKLFCSFPSFISIDEYIFGLLKQFESVVHLLDKNQMTAISITIDKLFNLEQKKINSKESAVIVEEEKDDDAVLKYFSQSLSDFSWMFELNTSTNKNEEEEEVKTKINFDKFRNKIILLSSLSSDWIGEVLEKSLFISILIYFCISCWTSITDLNDSGKQIIKSFLSSNSSLLSSSIGQAFLFFSPLNCTKPKYKFIELDSEITMLRNDSSFDMNEIIPKFCEMLNGYPELIGDLFLQASSDLQSCSVEGKQILAQFLPFIEQNSTNRSVSLIFIQAFLEIYSKGVGEEEEEEEEDFLSYIYSVLPTLLCTSEENPFSKGEIDSLNRIHQLILKIDPSFSSLTKEILENSEKNKETSINFESTNLQPNIEEQINLDVILKQIKSDCIPSIAHGLVELKRIVTRSKDCCCFTIDLQMIFNILVERLDHSDSFVYLNVIKCFVEITHTYQQETISFLFGKIVEEQPTSLSLLERLLEIISQIINSFTNYFCSSFIDQFMKMFFKVFPQATSPIKTSLLSCLSVICEVNPYCLSPFMSDLFIICKEILFLPNEIQLKQSALLVIKYLIGSCGRGIFNFISFSQLNALYQHLNSQIESFQLIDELKELLEWLINLQESH